MHLKNRKEGRKTRKQNRYGNCVSTICRWFSTTELIPNMYHRTIHNLMDHKIKYYNSICLFLHFYSDVRNNCIKFKFFYEKSSIVYFTPNVPFDYVEYLSKDHN